MIDGPRTRQLSRKHGFLVIQAQGLKHNSPAREGWVALSQSMQASERRRHSIEHIFRVERYTVPS